MRLGDEGVIVKRYSYERLDCGVRALASMLITNGNYEPLLDTVATLSERYVSSVVDARACDQVVRLSGAFGIQVSAANAQPCRRDTCNKAG